MRRIGSIAGLFAAALGTAVALACAGGPEAPVLSLEKSAYDPDGNSAILSPANDSRINMMLLLADRRPDGLHLLPPGKGAPLVMYRWDTLKERIEPNGERDAEDSPGRCQTNVSGAEAFAAAVAHAKGMPDAEKAALTAARRVSSGCDADGQAGNTTTPAASSQTGRAFVSYLAGSRSFYRGDFPAARASFAGITGSSDEWLRETTLYMVARTQLNAAQSTLFDEYGSILPVEKRDRNAIASAGVAFQAYLKAYPSGRYAASAQGLMRRIYWLAGDNMRLSAAYDTIIGRAEQSSAAADLQLAEEVDYKLFGDADASAATPTPGVTGAVLLAIDDLKKMRSQPYSDNYVPIAAAAIEAQRSNFGSNTLLFDYVQAAQAFFVGHQAARVLQLIPDASHQRRFTSLEFSRQMLRGLALESMKDANARQFLIDLLPGAQGPYQREAVELAIATHDERAGAIDRIFAAGSPVHNPIIREVLLSYTAGPGLLRKQSQDQTAPKRERDVALYFLLAKGVQHGLYTDFIRDIALVPPRARNETSPYFYDGSVEAADNELDVPLGLFTRPPNLGEFGCPPLIATAQALAANPQAVTPRICLAEFIRSNGFDHFGYDVPLEGRGLAGSKPLYPGPAYARQTVYQSIIATPGAADDERAYTLYRAVRCYAPSGNNDCGGKDVPVAQRRAWFRQLKTNFANSRWAKMTDLYW